MLVAFWGTTCPPCLEELPDLEALAGRYEQTDFVVLPVCVGETDARTVQEVGARYAPGLTVYVAPDDSVRERFGVRHLPQAVLVDREGRMLGRCYGGQRWKGQDFDRLLAACRRRTDPLETLAGRVVSSNGVRNAPARSAVPARPVCGAARKGSGLGTGRCNPRFLADPPLPAIFRPALIRVVHVDA